MIPYVRVESTLVRILNIVLTESLWFSSKWVVNVTCNEGKKEIPRDMTISQREENQARTG